MEQQYRQGDVLLVRVDTLPQDAVPEKGPVILAHGEVTGHCHQVRGRSAKLYRAAGERFLTVTKRAELTHQEHGTITLEAGVYQVRQQSEYQPDAIRSVAD